MQYRGARMKITVVIPTYQRERVLLDTIDQLLNLDPPPLEILIIDQTSDHEPITARALALHDSQNRIEWIRLRKPSITRAMNTGLKHSSGEVVVFLDDDIIPHPGLIGAHYRAHCQGEDVVAGQVLQPGESPTEVTEPIPFRFNSTRKQHVTEFIGCNFSVNRKLAISLGGFDENFVHVAYRFEAEFANRVLTIGKRILFEPEASVRHLKAERGGTRSYGLHLKTIWPSHSVGAYYFLLRSKNVSRRLLGVVTRPLRAVRTKHHFTHPWWIPATLASEAMGFAWAMWLYLRGPRLLNSTPEVGHKND